MPRLPTWGDVRTFCERQGFTQITTHHDYYEKEIAPGLTARTKISHGKDARTVPVELWKLVWHEQLRLRTEEDFWSGLDGQPFQYDIPPRPLPPEPLPSYLRRHLVDRLHYSEEEVARTPRDEAQRLFDLWCSQQET